MKNGNENADERGVSPINNLSTDYLRSAFTTAVQNSVLTAGTTGNASSVVASTDNQQLSPFAQMMSMLQKLQQSSPTKYQQVTQQIAANLQNAAKTAQAEGNTAAATQLNQLATDFTNASKSGQLPSVQDLAQAVGVHHHHHHVHPAQTASDTDATECSSSSASANQPLNQLLSTLQANGTQNDSPNPMTIILNTLSTAGITSSNS